jgi:hypothetical protein
MMTAFRHSIRAAIPDLGLRRRVSRTGTPRHGILVVVLPQRGSG